MIKEFQEFIAKGNVMDLAVGVIIGGAFGLIVNSLVGDIIMPVVGMAGSADFSNYFYPLSDAVTATSLAEAKKQGPVFAYGNFITVVINFLILAFIIFLMVNRIAPFDRDAHQPSAGTAPHHAPGHEPPRSATSTVPDRQTPCCGAANAGCPFATSDAPVGLCVTRTALSVRFWCCPPGPPPRRVRKTRSAS